MKNISIQTVEVTINDLIPADYNPRKHDEVATEQLKQSILRFGLVDPIIANSSPDRKNIIIGGHFRWQTALALGYQTVPVVYIDIPDLAKEKELNLRLNKNTGELRKCQQIFRSSAISARARKLRSRTTARSWRAFQWPRTRSGTALRDASRRPTGSA